MKIALVTMDYPPQIGGVAQYLSQLVKASNGDMVAFVDEKHPEDKLASVKRIKLFREGRLSWLPAIFSIYFLKHRKFDSVFISHVLPLGTAALIARVLGGLPYTVLIHGLDLRSALRSKIKTWIMRRVLRSALVIHTNSEFVAKQVRSFDNTLFPVVVTPGVETQALLSRENARQELGVSDDTFLILTVSRLVARKGIDSVILALKELPENVKYVIVGDGPDKERLKTLAAVVADRVKFVTDATNEERDKWFAAADVFAFVAREEGDDIEGFGIVCLEAGLASLPVIAGRSGGVPEAVKDGETGIAVNPTDQVEIRDAIMKIRSCPEARKQMGEAGRRRAIEDFKWEDRWKKISCDKRVSIIIPVYNHAKELMSCLAALERQTIKPKEVIIVNDASPDDVDERLSRYKSSIPLKYIRRESNHGAPAARNEGFRHSSGDFVLFLDADTILRPDALERMARTLDCHPEAAFVYCAFYLGWKKFPLVSFSNERLRRSNFIDTRSMMRREVFPGFDETLKKFQDWDLWLTVVENGGIGVGIADTLFTFSHHARSKGGMSKWLPSFFHRIKWPLFGCIPEEVARYRAAEDIIRKKHKI